MSNQTNEKERDKEQYKQKKKVTHIVLRFVILATVGIGSASGTSSSGNALLMNLKDM